MLLITGATAYTAQNFFKRLEESSYEGKIRCLVRKESDLSSLKSSSLDMEFFYGDLNDPSCLQNAMIGVKTVLHISGIGFSPTIVEIGQKAGVEWFILVHTTGRYSKFKSAAKEYIQIEDTLLGQYSNLTILRPTMIYGGEKDKNMWKLISYLNNHRYFPVFGWGNNLMQPVYAGDLGDAYAAVLNNKGKAFGKQYNLGGKDRIKYIDLLKTVSSELNSKTIFVRLPLWLSILGARLYNFLFGNSALISVEQVFRMGEDKVFSWDNAHQDFGYTPKSFQEGIKLEIKEFREKTKAAFNLA